MQAPGQTDTSAWPPCRSLPVTLHGDCLPCSVHTQRGGGGTLVKIQIPSKQLETGPPGDPVLRVHGPQGGTTVPPLVSCQEETPTQCTHLLPDACPQVATFSPSQPQCLVGLPPTRVQRSETQPPNASCQPQKRNRSSTTRSPSLPHGSPPPLPQRGRRRAQPTETCTHAHAHAHIHTHIPHMHTHTHTCACTYTSSTRVDIYIHPHAYTYAHASIHTHSCHICCTQYQPCSWPSVNSPIALLGSRPCPACSEAPPPLCVYQGPQA